MDRCRCCSLIPVVRTSRTRTMAIGRFPRRNRTRRRFTRSCQEGIQRGNGGHPHGPFLELKPIKQNGGKIVHAWAFHGDCDPRALVSNTISIEWPPKSDKKWRYPKSIVLNFSMWLLQVERSKRRKCLDRRVTNVLYSACDHERCWKNMLDSLAN